ncbi:MAG: aspartate-semialdehyde dehydrogenase [Planctomycetes bacterium]|nr:aspartate-semialdehyde dehydrogenase [Planctomycetota bacterium]
MERKYNIAVVGATGAVGLEILKILAERRFPVKSLHLYASERSAGRILTFKSLKFKVQELKRDSFKEVDFAFFSPGSAVSKKWVPIAQKSGAVVIDNTSAFRMDKNVPLVVPEVNAHTLKSHKGIIANPNCATIQLVVALKPLHDYARIKRIVVTTFQSVSGAGLRALSEMEQEARLYLKSQTTNSNFQFHRRIFPHQIAFNIIPQIPQSDAFEPTGYTGEETKVINETKKIMGDYSIKVTSTCVRMPVYRCHSESVNIETAKPLSVSKARELLRKAPGVRLMDDVSKELYPTPAELAGCDAVYVGRIRKDATVKNGLNLWVVSDNIRKGAALNAVQIAEILTAEAPHSCRQGLPIIRVSPNSASREERGKGR